MTKEMYFTIGSLRLGNKRRSCERYVCPIRTYKHLCKVTGCVVLLSLIGLQILAGRCSTPRGARISPDNYRTGPSLVLSVVEKGTHNTAKIPEAARAIDRSIPNARVNATFD